MSKYYEVLIDKTSKAVANNSDKWQKGWQCWDQERKVFKTVKEVKEFLRDEYGHCKSAPDKMYRDLDSEEAKHVGYIYKLGIVPPSNYDEISSYERHWVEVSELKSKSIIIKV